MGWVQDQKLYGKPCFHFQSFWIHYKLIREWKPKNTSITYYTITPTPLFFIQQSHSMCSPTGYFNSFNFQFHQLHTPRTSSENIFKNLFFLFLSVFWGWKTILGLKITGWFCLRAGWLKDRFLFSLNNVIVFVLIYSFLTAGWQCRQMIDGAGIQIPTSGWLIVLEFKL